MYKVRLRITLLKETIITPQKAEALLRGIEERCICDFTSKWQLVGSTQVTLEESHLLGKT